MPGPNKSNSRHSKKAEIEKSDSEMFDTDVDMKDESSNETEKMKKSKNEGVTGKDKKEKSIKSEPNPSAKNKSSDAAESSKSEEKPKKGKSKPKQVKVENNTIKGIVGARIETEAFWRRIFSKSALLGTHFNENRCKLLNDNVRFPKDKFVSVKEYEERLGEKVSSDKKDKPLPRKKQPKLASQEDADHDQQEKDVEETEAEQTADDEESDKECAAVVENKSADKKSNSKASNSKDKGSKPRKLVYTLTFTLDAKSALRCIVERIRWEIHEMLTEFENVCHEWKNVDPFSIEGKRLIINKIRESGFDNCFTEMALYIIDRTDMIDDLFIDKWEQDFSKELSKELSSKIRDGKICNFISTVIAKFLEVVISRATKTLWSKKSQGLNKACVESILLDYIEYGKYLPGETQRMPNVNDVNSDERSILHLVQKYVTTLTPPKKKKVDTKKNTDNDAKQIGLKLRDMTLSECATPDTNSKEADENADNANADESDAKANTSKKAADAKKKKIIRDGKKKAKGQPDQSCDESQ